MAQQKRRPANDRAFKKYKAEGMRKKNKIRKLAKYCKKNPNDKQAQENLERIKSEALPDKRPPVNNGINRTKQVQFTLNVPSNWQPTSGRTAAEQLSELLGIAIPNKTKRKKSKPKVTQKRKKRVQT